MRILFASVNHLPHIGGVELTTHQLSRRLVERGHCVAVLTGLLPWSGPPALAHRVLARWLRITQNYRAFHDNSLGYSVYRALEPIRAAKPVVEEFFPDVLVINAGSVRFAEALIDVVNPLPTVVYFHGLSALGILQRPNLRANLFLAVAPHLTSMATSRGYQAKLMPPLVEQNVYRRPVSRQVVLFVNPIEAKGVDIAWALAKQCPDIPFVFLKAWQLSKRDAIELRARSRTLKNVEIRNAVRDPERIYNDTRVLLAPYPSSEGYPRVIAEAQMLGIPVVATDVPALRFVAGDGAVYVGEDSPISEWETALRLLWDDARAYERHSKAALLRGARAEVDPLHVAEQFENELVAAIASRQLECACFGE